MDTRPDEARIRVMLAELTDLMHKHGAISEPVRQYVRAEAKAPVGDFHSLALTLILTFATPGEMFALKRRNAMKRRALN